MAAADGRHFDAPLQGGQPLTTSEKAAASAGFMADSSTQHGRGFQLVYVVSMRKSKASNMFVISQELIRSRIGSPHNVELLDNEADLMKSLREGFMAEYAPRPR